MVEVSSISDLMIQCTKSCKVCNSALHRGGEDRLRLEAQACRRSGRNLFRTHLYVKTPQHQSWRPGPDWGVVHISQFLRDPSPVTSLSFVFHERDVCFARN
jgi:hypothetical protein